MTPEELASPLERLPYFATLWPAGRALAARLLAGEGLQGSHVLDLGCGLGPGGLSALVRGARVVFLDWDPRALALVARSAARLGGSPAGTVEASFLDPPLRDLGRFDLVLASDLLYEARNLAPVARFLAAALGPRGRALVADPGRARADAFPEVAAAAGLAVLDLWRSDPPQGPSIRVWTFARATPAAGP